MGIFGAEYLHAPTLDSLKHILSMTTKQDFSGMLESLDSIHLIWKNCPPAWDGHFTGKEKELNIMLEAVAS